MIRNVEREVTKRISRLKVSYTVFLQSRQRQLVGVMSFDFSIPWPPTERMWNTVERKVKDKFSREDNVELLSITPLVEEP